MKTAGKRALNCDFNILLRLIKEGQWVHRAGRGGLWGGREPEGWQAWRKPRKKEERGRGLPGTDIGTPPNPGCHSHPPEPLSHDHHKRSLRTDQGEPALILHILNRTEQKLNQPNLTTPGEPQTRECQGLLLMVPSSPRIRTRGCGEDSLKDTPRI